MCIRDSIKTGELKEHSVKLISQLENCTLCPRHCGVNRLENELGQCRTGRYTKVSSYGPHFGEEPPLVGNQGSGTIFFTNCNLNCIFCQNYDISQLGHGFEVKPTRLAQMMIELQNMGCHNINFVSPTHVIPQIVEALILAIDDGLKVPLVYNSGGYDEIVTLKQLDSIFDIYMPDAKYGDDATAFEFSGIKEYFTINKKALKEMHRQVGDLIIENGVAQKGLLIRHLVLPHNLAQSENVLKFIAQEVSKNSYVNIMDQYRPCYKADKFPYLSRPLNFNEYTQVLKTAQSFGLHRFA